MCGIAGKIFFEPDRQVDEFLIKNMCTTLVHRGPDDEGTFADGNFGFGMRRLSIIDVQGGHQPIFNEDKSLAIVFNGEIYNYRELKQELETRGHRFKTNSDTETILHAYEEYGVGCLQKLNGMFAIAIRNVRNDTLFLARDRIGIKPLYYYQDHEKLVFGSEIKAILQDRSIERMVNRQALDLYLSFMYVPAPHSMFEKIHKLPPAHYLLCQQGRVTLKRYWDLEFQPNLQKSEHDFIQEFNALFEDSVRLRMLSEVPLGAFLSGGVDSSSIVAVMSQLSNQPVKTFSIGFKEGGYHDETMYAEMVAQQYHTEHTEFKVDANMLLELLPKYVYHFDEPFADYAAFPTYVVSKLAREHVTVVLTGDGGDEVFAGYKRYWTETLAAYYQQIPAGVRKHFLGKLLKFGAGVTPIESRSHLWVAAALKKHQLMHIEPMSRYIQSFYKFHPHDKHELFSDEHSATDDFSEQEFSSYLNGREQYDALSKRLYLDQMTLLPEDMLTKVDRVTMAVSLEARVPFLDHRIVEFTATIPPHLKMNLFTLKRFVKHAVRDKLPRQIINRAKHGFSSPIDQWLRYGLKDLLQDTLSKEAIKGSGMFNADYIGKLRSQHLTAKANHGEKLFMLMVFQMWHERFVK